MADKSGLSWKTWAAAAAAGAFSFFAVIALAQTTGGSSGPSDSGPSGGHSHGGGAGVGVSVDFSKLFSDSHETRPANEWQNLPQQPVSTEGEHGLIVFTPPRAEPGYPQGVHVEVKDGTREFGGINVLLGDGRAVEVPMATGECPKSNPCPEAEELQAANAALQSQIDELKKENEALKSSVSEKAICEAKEKDCEKKLAAANAQIASLQNQLSAAQAAAAQPGDGAKAIAVPFSVTYYNDDEIVHYGWDVIRAVFEGNSLRVENHTEEWIASNPDLPKDKIDSVRANYGGIPGGSIDFGSTLFDGGTLRDRVEHLCEPRPSPEELKAKKSVDHILGIHYNKQTQKITATSNGKDVPVTQQTINETSFDLDLTAECHWSYENGEVKKHVMIQLSVQYQDKGGNMREVKYVADNPQMGWIMKS